MKKKQYGLFTTIAMIVGIVIGSGIFFKSDNILTATNGSILQGVLAFILAAVTIVFGSLAFTQFAKDNDEPGGVIAYTEEQYSSKLACAVGWYQAFIYLPSLIAVVASVTGVYIGNLFGFEASLEAQLLIGIVTMLLCFIMNIMSAKLAGYFQSGATIIKLFPLIFIAVAGLIFGNVSNSIHYHSGSVQVGNLIGAVPAITFSFDGWVIATSINNEVKNSKKNLPRALVISPIIILCVYLLYFVGISSYLGPETIIAMGDDHVSYAAAKLLGNNGAKYVMVFVIVSVIGTVNGVILGLIRIPKALAEKKLIPKPEWFKKDKPAGYLSLFSCLVWILLHYFTQKFKLMPNSDVSELNIVLSYLSNIILYIAIIRMAVKGDIRSRWKGYVIPALALLGAGFVLMGVIKNPLFWPVIIVYGGFITVAMWYASKASNKLKSPTIL